MPAGDVPACRRRHPDPRLTRVSAGILVTDGVRLLLGHASRSPRWDIPKGIVEPGETHADAAVRELREETGLTVEADALIGLGLHAYLPAKDLALFCWRPAEMPDPGRLICTAMVQLPRGGAMPELDRFGLFEWQDALAKVGRNLARVLSKVESLALGRGLR